MADAVRGDFEDVLAPRIVNDVSHVTRINHQIHFSWQAQYLVELEADFCCIAHERVISSGRRSFGWSWRQTFVPARAINDISYVGRINHESHLAWQAQYLAKVECDLLWQTQRFVKF